MTIRLRILILFVLQTGFALLLGAEPTEVKYRGFTIDDSRIAAAEDLKAIIRATEEQIDIVWEVGLPDGHPEIFERSSV